MTVILPILVAFTCALPPLSSPTDIPAKAAARARQEAVKSVDFRFRRTEIMTKGGKSAAESGILNPVVPRPLNALTFESTNRLVLDGVKRRFEDNHPFWETLQTRNGTRLIVFDGTTAKMFDPTAPGVEKGRGIIDNSFRSLLSRGLDLMPIALALRGLDRDLARDWIDTMKPTAVTFAIDGVACQEYVISPSLPLNRWSQSWSFWLDPDRDYIVRRICLALPDGRRDQTDIQYRSNAVCGWVPASWERRQYGPDGVVGVTNKIEVLELRLNEVQPLELFDIVFPPGIEVQDNATKPYMRYRVEPDGSLRSLLPDPAPAWYRKSKSWVYVGFGLILGYLILTLAVRRLKAQ